MKKFILPLLLLLAVGMLAAVESDPSAVVGYVKYECQPGLNFIALPMDAGFTLASEAVAAYNLNGEIDNISVWVNDPLVQTWDTTTHQGDNFFDPDPVVGPGSVIYITYVGEEPFDYYSIGALPETNASYTIEPGQNTVMVPLNRSDITLGSLLATSIGFETVDNISVWINDPMIQTWDTTTNQGEDFFDPDHVLSIGYPVFLTYVGDTTTVWPEGLRNVKNLKNSTRRK